MYFTTLKLFSDLCYRFPIAGLHALRADVQVHSYTHMPTWLADRGLGGGGGGGDGGGSVICDGVTSGGVWSGIEREGGVRVGRKGVGRRKRRMRMR